MSCFTADVYARSGIIATDGTIDQECIWLWEVLRHIPGVEAIAACSGHGTQPLRVWFTVDRLETLAVLLAAHRAWRCEADASCPCCPVRFTLIAQEPSCL